MKRIGLLLLVAFFCSFTSAFAQNGNSIVKFGDLHGEVNVRPNSEDDDAYIFAELNTPLKHDDRIRTLPKSGAILSFSDMSTFVMKEDSVIVLDIANEKDTKIGLVAGNIWVNLKKMVADGSMEIEMSQAVAGLKGTNITCSTSHGEDRIQVLRGIAEVLIKESREKITVSEGEELIVKSGGKTEKVEIDVAAEQKKWEDATSRMGESIQMNEVPETLKSILDAESSEFARINETFMRLVAMEKVELEVAMEIKKDAERFIGVLLEDALIMSSMRKKVDTALQLPEITAAERVQFVSLMKDIASVVAKQQAFQAQITKIMRYEFKLSAVTEDISAEMEILRTELAQSTADVDAVKAVLSANPSGQGQDWFKESSEVCAAALVSLDELSQKVSELLAENPTSVELQALVKSIADQQIAISTMLKSLAVVEIDSGTITEMAQIDDTMSDQLTTLQNEIAVLNSLGDATIADKENKFVSSVRVMSNFAKVRRQYINSQRLYETTAKATSSSKYRTSEMDELENTYRRISDNFQQLGIVADQLQLNIQDLENQLSTHLK
ncbi:MAG: hypothetical protein ACD_39C00957G0001 [uncultured bacterium]|nr:MAG: hypothetical protein ACD_39C00957G0001 [uncultured bacterium]